MIQVYDDLLPPTLVDRIEQILTNEHFYWFALDNLSLGGQEAKREFVLPEGYRYIETSGMTKPFYSFSTWYDPYSMYMLTRMIIDYFCEASGTQIEQLIRVKANLLTPNPNAEYNNDNCIHYPHIDFYNDHLVLVYYVNDSDGDTVIFNEKWDGEKDNIVELSMNKRVTPKRGRIVAFDGRYYHTSQNPVNSPERIILNINIGYANTR